MTVVILSLLEDPRRPQSALQPCCMNSFLRCVLSVMAQTILHSAHSTSDQHVSCRFVLGWSTLNASLLFYCKKAGGSKRQNSTAIGVSSRFPRRHVQAPDETWYFRKEFENAPFILRNSTITKTKEMHASAIDVSSCVANIVLVRTCSRQKNRYVDRLRRMVQSCDDRRLHFVALT